MTVSSYRSNGDNLSDGGFNDLGPVSKSSRYYFLKLNFNFDSMQRVLIRFR